MQSDPIYFDVLSLFALPLLWCLGHAPWEAKRAFNAFNSLTQSHIISPYSIRSASAQHCPLRVQVDGSLISRGTRVSLTFRQVPSFPFLPFPCWISLNPSFVSFCPYHTSLINIYACLSILFCSSVPSLHCHCSYRSRTITGSHPRSAPFLSTGEQRAREGSRVPCV
jgi:hypothetical protein